MLSLFIMLILFCSCGFLQLQLPALALFGQVKPPLLLSIVLYYALHHENTKMYIVAVFVGFLQDALGLIPLGFSSCAFCFVGACVARYRMILLAESVITRSFFGAIGAGAVTLIVYLLLVSQSLVQLSLGRLIHKILGAGFYGLIVTPIVCECLWRVDNMLGNIFIREVVEDTTGEIEDIA